ncbi:thioredoxin-dependent thiol peroxidase [Ruminiclostridium cellobioparum]|jgi:peroxiredoxin Q/BCP|uniref:thioredoxin-dependent thiol peroxidase n=1 Tax=Ruminiclostridium cellobioparum TaxID=29355 RepID=UPI000485063A|nr:thioredoxin-dependent thiol peroxidase [Ruminiclostridium cellobioparum]
MLKAGEKAVNFVLKTTDDKEVSLSDFKGKKIVLYFYPKDDTPGCTKEACGFRDVYDYILEAGAVVVGISPDGEKSHDKFRNKYNLPFYLLSDEDHKVSEAYGAWGERKMYGKTYMGIIRSTFIIDEEMVIQKVFQKVSPEGHAEEVLDLLTKR